MGTAVGAVGSGEGTALGSGVGGAVGIVVLYALARQLLGRKGVSPLGVGGEAGVEKA